MKLISNASHNVLCQQYCMKSLIVVVFETKTTIIIYHHVSKSLFWTTRHSKIWFWWQIGITEQHSGIFNFSSYCCWSQSVFIHILWERNKFLVFDEPKWLVSHLSYFARFEGSTIFKFVMFFMHTYYCA